MSVLKKILVLSGGLLTAVILLVVFWQFRDAGRLSQVGDLNNQFALGGLNLEQIQKLNRERCQRTAQPQECEDETYDAWSERINTQIRVSGEFLRCPELGLVDMIDACYRQLAYNLNNVSICQEISQPAQQQFCAENLVPKQNNFSLCHSLSSVDKKTYCYQTVVGNMKSLDECDALSPADRDLCREVFITQAALTNQDYDLCQTLGETSRVASCLKRLPADTDGDKLSDYAEKHFFRTNPKNPDTDGDGFTDGVEVKNGFDPLKK